ncbi:D-alanyl-D-alanine carboxypeptidase [Planotetraspora silvatica]|uniref:D-alanyl-D-alanine carboxypeptidase n=1 Tax=Planotetraspora silvatica TaxID=234614 RepID=A0A8J3ULI5_9ACTN|nr:D-alanyl-D-alanine carboxypeptidase [Planotetraspora silvatica]GII47222.1 D-alanyl-D-alanine carboxypeptidase [Planotetraspora silvatica]
MGTNQRALAAALITTTLIGLTAAPAAGATIVRGSLADGSGLETGAPDTATVDAESSASASPDTGRLNDTQAAVSSIGGRLLGGRGLIAPAGIAPPPKTEASAFLIADADTGQVLAAKDPHGHYRPASTLKTLTAVTLIPKLDKDRWVKPSQWACDEEGSAVGIVPEPIYQIDDLMRAMLIVSGNDAADALAEANGSLAKTLADMNKEARKLQAYDTVAKTPNGLDKPGQRSSAYDLALIARAGLAMPDFRKYVSTRTSKFPAPKDFGKKKDRNRQGDDDRDTPTPTKTPPAYYEIANHNKLLGKYKGMIGIKNGYTTKALGSFVGAATRNGHTIIVVIMHHPGGFWEEVEKLLDWGFAADGKVTPVGELVKPTPPPSPKPSSLAVRHSPAAQAPVSGAGWTDHAPLVATAVLGVGLAGAFALGYGLRRRRRAADQP